MPDSIILFQAVLFIGTGLLFVLLALPLIRRRVPPNLVYGLRTPTTLADEAVWYEANARCGRELLVLGLGIVLLAVGLLFVPRAYGLAYVIAMTGVLFVGAILIAVRGWRTSKRLTNGTLRPPRRE